MDIELAAVRNDPDAAGLIGAAHLVPSWVFKGHEAILAADVSGTNFRAGIIDLNLKRASNLSKASVWKSDQCTPTIEELAKMLRKLITQAEHEGLRLPPSSESVVLATSSRTEIEGHKTFQAIGRR